jgi:methenyltetrahydrofolate cyclohydrolase
VLATALLAGAEEDIAAFGGVSAAHRLPRGSAAATAAREAAIHDALVAASRAPLENARLALRALELGDELAGRSNAAAASDLAAARLLAGVAVTGCLMNVEANLDALPHSVAAASLRRQAEDVRTAHARAGAPVKETTT